MTNVNSAKVGPVASLDPVVDIKFVIFLELVDIAKKYRAFLDNVPGCSDLECKQSLCLSIRADRLRIDQVLLRSLKGE